MRTRRPTGPQPYAHDAEYLDHLVLGVRARAYHLGALTEARREAEEAAGHVISLVGVGTPAGAPEVARLASIDKRVWADIDARREATRGAGVILGLDALIAQHDLDDIDRWVLVLATIPCVGLDMFDTLGNIASFSFALLSVTPEMIALFAGLDLASRLDLIDRLGPDGRLLQAELIEFDPGDRVQDFWSTGVFLTAAAFDAICGRRAVDPNSKPPAVH